MKLFLKPTAIFACIALLFCACGDDETEDLSYTLAPVTLAAPVDMSVASGNGRAALTWRVPDDSSITHAMIQWDNTDEAAGLSANLNEITRVEVVPNSKATYYIYGEAGDLEASLESRNHNFKITHIKVNSSKTITDRSETAEVNSFFIYSNATYANSLPNPYSISTSGTSTANISWSRFDEDLYSVKLSYTDIYGDTIEKTDDFFIDEDNPTITLDDVKMDTQFKFYAYFLPENGLDIVEIESTTDLDMSSSAASPTSVAVVPGLGRMRVRWMIPTNESIVSSIVQYKRVADNSGNTLYNTSTVQIQYGGDKISSVDYYYDEDVLINNRNERYISGATDPSGNSDDESGGLWASIRPLTYLTSGYYEVSVINVKENGKYSTPVEEDGTLQTIHVYGYDSFTHATLSGVPLRDVSGVVKFDFIENLTWNNATSVCTGVTLYYTDGNGDAQSQSGTLDYFSETGLSDTKVATTFTYETHFSPGLDDLTLEAETAGDNSFIPDVAPNAPQSVTAQAGITEVSDTGNFSNQVPVIHVTWTPDENAVADNITNYRIYWYATSGDVYKTDYLSIDVLDVTTDGEYTYTLTENLETDTKYYVEIVSASEELEGIDGRTESEKTEVFDRPVTYSYETYKDVLLEWGAVKNNGYTSSIVWSSIPSDCVGVAVFYNKANTPNTRYPESGYSELSAVASITPLESAIVGESFKYIVYHKPTSGVEPVKVWNTDEQSGVIPEPVPVPTISDAITGYSVETSEDGTEVTYNSYIVLTWTSLIDTDKIVDKMYLRFAPSGGEATDVRVSLTATTLTLSTENYGIEAGTSYDFQIVTEDSDEQDFNGDNLTSESEVMTVKAYNSETYTVADMPIATASISGDINVTWSNVSDDIESIEFTYGSTTTTYTRDQLLDGFTVSYDSSLDQKFTYSATFCPTGGETKVVIDGGMGMALIAPAVSDDYVVSGTTWTIYTGAGLKAFATMVNSSSSARGLNAVLANDIDMSSVCGSSSTTGSWTPIGTSTTAAYTGTFDGNGKKIFGLYINATTSYQGLFGCISAATVKDVILEDPKIVSTKQYMAGIAAYAASSSKIEGCIVRGDYGYIYSDLLAAATSMGSMVGRLVGSYIINCSNYMDITSGVDGTSTGRNIGGIVGDIATTAGYVIGCYNEGLVMSAGYTVGGIVGSTSVGTSKIIGCHNAGDVYVTTCYNASISGYVTAATDFVGCYNTGGLVTTGNFVGFLMGRYNDVVINMIGCCNAGYVYDSRSLTSSNFTGNMTGGCSVYTSANSATYGDAYLYGIRTGYQTATGCVYVASSDFVSSTVGEYVLSGARYHDNAFGLPTLGAVTDDDGNVLQSAITQDDGTLDWTGINAVQNLEGSVTRVTTYATLNAQVSAMNAAIVNSKIASALGYNCVFTAGTIASTDLPTLEVTAIE